VLAEAVGAVLALGGGAGRRGGRLFRTVHAVAVGVDVVVAITSGRRGLNRRLFDRWSNGGLGTTTDVGASTWLTPGTAGTLATPQPASTTAAGTASTASSRTTGFIGNLRATGTRRVLLSADHAGSLADCHTPSPTPW
jgi:hypothetical protein